MNLPPLQAEARLKCDIKAITTIAITIVTYFLCYVPSIVYAVTGLQSENQAEHLVWVQCMVLPVHLKCCQPAHLLSTNQQVSFCFQTVPQRSFRIKRLQREASQPQKPRRKTKS